MICWPGLILSRTSLPMLLDLTSSINLRVTRKFTSASSRAMRTSFNPSTRSFYVILPLFWNLENTEVNLSDSASNKV